MCVSVCICNVDFCFFVRFGGEFVVGEDEIDGFKRFMIEVNIFF